MERKFGFSAIFLFFDKSFFYRNRIGVFGAAVSYFDTVDIEFKAIARQINFCGAHVLRFAPEAALRKIIRLALFFNSGQGGEEGGVAGDKNGLVLGYLDTIWFRKN